MPKNSDPRFASISSSPIMDSYGDSTNYNNYNTYGDSISSFLGNAFSVTKNIASNVSSSVQEKVTEYEVGDKLYQAGGKTADILYSASYKVYEKGSEIAVWIYFYYLIY